MEFGKADWRTFERGIEKEWLLTNGIGSFASSTIIGANTRRYHGLLVASLRPPVRRHLILSKIDETVYIGSKAYNIYSYKTSDSILNGYQHLQRVRVDSVITFEYCVEDLWIEKKVSMVYGENTVVILYRVISGNTPAVLRLTPLVNFRDYHHNANKANLHFTRDQHQKDIALRPYNSDERITIYCSSGKFTEKENTYFENMFYPIESERGLQPVEDHYIPGFFDIEIGPGEDKSVTVIATLEHEITNRDGAALIRNEQDRVLKIVESAGCKDSFACMLVKAADTFIVSRKSTGTKTIIAGYPWFTDWGRDTMIAFSGLTLATRRFEDAREILYTFSQYAKDGLLPNMFPDEGEEPGYNTVDAPLWYFEAVNKYIAYTGDKTFIKEKIYEVLKKIISAYKSGTRFHIHMEEDHLIHAGDPGTQLTWMDAKVGDWVVTPRHGKPVEVNALWYNALRVMAKLAGLYSEDSRAYEELADSVKQSFIKAFWNPEKQCLYDVVTDHGKDDRVRPNQILAISLSYPVIEGTLARDVINIVWKELYTAYGLRTLSPRSGEYRGIYIGDPYQRDSAYHQGTVWTWLLGHFITAFVRVNGPGEATRERARKFIEPFKDHLRDACIGNISEIFDGDDPHVPRGCFAQAWSISEVLRAYREDILGKD